MKKLLNNPFTKVRNIVTLGIVCMLLFAVISCGNSKMEDSRRLCSENKFLSDIQLVPRGEAYLFRDFVPEQMISQIDNQLHSYPFPILSWIVYRSETGVATITFAGNKEVHRTLFADRNAPAPPCLC